ncbi:MAG: hypothetical protein HKM93_00815 [Desulfobacteraceae bacterium]|nr:hypothetical protein [Desulfobacteraceae bacterium]
MSPIGLLDFLCTLKSSPVPPETHPIKAECNPLLITMRSIYKKSDDIDSIPISIKTAVIKDPNNPTIPPRIMPEPLPIKPARKLGRTQINKLSQYETN